MLRLLLLLSLAPGALAQGARAAREGADLLDQALRLQANPPPGMGQDDALDKAYLMMGEAIQKDPRLWQALLQRGINRCDKMLLAHRTLRAHILSMRATGETDAEIARVEGLGKDFITGRIRRDALQNFATMERLMKKLGEPTADTVLFANALMKFSNGDYLKAEGSTTGAIDDLKKLIQRKWMPQFCAERIALAYLDLGASEFAERRYDEAHAYWDKGLRWVQSDRIRRFLLTNKAGAFEVDDEYALAEKLLREQIRSELDRPSHWKNLGLVLGYQNQLRPALYCYRQSRDLCGELGKRSIIARFNGNSWLKAAMIHGKLLEADGDLRRAWTLFLEYRAMFGDDYNFCFNFGEFAFHMGQYKLAWDYLKRAQKLQPFCPPTALILVRVAQRMTDGTLAEQRARREEAKKGVELARERSSAQNESPQLKRICGGLQDLGDGDLRRRVLSPMVPDPLAGYSFDTPPPPWIVKRADQRDRFVPMDISPEEFLVKSPEEAEAAAETAQTERESEMATRQNWKWLAIGAGGLVLLLGAIALIRRRAA